MIVTKCDAQLQKSVRIRNSGLSVLRVDDRRSRNWWRPIFVSLRHRYSGTYSRKHKPVLNIKSAKKSYTYAIVLVEYYPQPQFIDIGYYYFLGMILLISY